MAVPGIVRNPQESWVGRAFLPILRVLIGPKYLSYAMHVSFNVTKIILGVKNVIK